MSRNEKIETGAAASKQVIDIMSDSEKEEHSSAEVIQGTHVQGGSSASLSEHSLARRAESSLLEHAIQERGPAGGSLKKVGGSAETPRPLCENGCEGDDAVQTHWCQECAKAICDFCVEAHRRRGHTKNHVLTKISTHTFDALQGKAGMESDTGGKLAEAVSVAAGTEIVCRDVDMGKADGIAKAHTEGVEAAERRATSGHDDERTAKDFEMREGATVAIEDGEEEEGGEDADEEEDGNNDYCEVCKGGGELVCCDFCECAYHGLKCLNARAEDLPDPYECPKCTGELATYKAEYKKRRMERKRAKRQMQESGKGRGKGSLEAEGEGGDEQVPRKSGVKKGKRRQVVDSDDEMQDVADDEESDGGGESDEDASGGSSSSDGGGDDESDASEPRKAPAPGRMRRLTRVQTEF